MIESNYDNAYTNNGGKASYNFTYTKSMLATATFNRKSSAPTSVNNDDKSFMWYPMLVNNADFKAMAAQRWDAVKGMIPAESVAEDLKVKAAMELVKANAVAPAAESAEEKKPARKPRAKKAKAEDEAPATEETSAE